MALFSEEEKPTGSYVAEWSEFRYKSENILAWHKHNLLYFLSNNKNECKNSVAQGKNSVSVSVVAVPTHPNKQREKKTAKIPIYSSHPIIDGRRAK